MLTLYLLSFVCSFSESRFCLMRGNILCLEETANSRLSTEKYVLKFTLHTMSLNDCVPLTWCRF